MPMLKTAVLTLVAVGVAIAQSSYDDERFHDWGRVHELQPGRQIVVRPFKGMGSKVFATYVSSDATGIVVRLKNDQKLEISRDRIRSVMRRKRMRNAVLIGAATAFAVTALSTACVPDLVQPLAALFFGGSAAGFGAIGGSLVRLVGRNVIVYRAAKRRRGQSSNLEAPDEGKGWAGGEVRRLPRPFA